MNETIKPKLKPKDVQRHLEKPVSVLKPVVQVVGEVVQSVIATGEAPTLDHTAQLHGLGLLTEIAKMGEVLIGSRRASHVPLAGPHPVDPRKLIDPRTRIKPR